MKRILMLSFRVPYPPNYGAKIRIYNMGRLLSNKYEVDLLAIDDERISESYTRELEKVFHKIIIFPFNSTQFKLNALKGLISTKPLQMHYYYFKQVQNWINNYYTDYNLIYCSHIRMAEYVRRLASKKVIDFIDATSINYRDAIDRAGLIWKQIYSIENKRLLSYELKVACEFDKVFITSNFDKKYLEGHLKSDIHCIEVIPNGINEDILSLENTTMEENIVFIGKMNYHPNEDAVIYFSRDIFPTLKKKFNDLRFIIVGMNPSNKVIQLRDMNGIEVTGFVENPYEYLQKSKIVVVPLRFGAGIQNKTLEAMALGKAVITTSVGVRGIEGVDGEHFIIADSRTEMISAISELLIDKSLRKQIGTNARELIKKTYRWSISEKILYTTIEEILGNENL